MPSANDSYLRNKEVKGRVSIIIPTLNASRTIGICLRSVLAQTYHNIEILVVDRNSSDRTRQISSKFGANVFIAGTERASQVNYGIQRATGEFIYYIGADFFLDRQLIQLAVEAATQCNADGVKIANYCMAETFWGKCRALEKFMNHGEDLIEVPRFLRRTAVQALGGFDQSLFGPEEWDLGARFVRSGFSSVRVYGAAEWHVDEPQDLRQVVRRALYYGGPVMRYVRMHPFKAALQYLPLRVFWLKKWRKYTRYPSCLLGLVLMKNLEYASGVMGALLKLGTYYKDSPKAQG